MTGSWPPGPLSAPPHCHWDCRWASAGAAEETSCDAMQRSQAGGVPAEGPGAGAAGRGGVPSSQGNRAAAAAAVVDTD